MPGPGQRGRLSRSESLHQQVARNNPNAIAAGVLRDGQPLPSTRELAEQWGVSVYTITEATKILVDEGLIISKSRSGRVVNAPAQSRQDTHIGTPHIVLVGGYAGSGKTEFGRVLTRETGWAMLDKDTLTRPVVEAALEAFGCSPHDRESETYLTFIRPREYEALISTMTENVQCGSSTIVTAPFIREFGDEAWINRVTANASDLGATLSIVWVYCDASTMSTYIRHRGAARDAVKISDWEAYLGSIDLDFRPAAHHAVVNNSASSPPLQAQAKALIAGIVGVSE